MPNTPFTEVIGALEEAGWELMHPWHDRRLFVDAEKPRKKPPVSFPVQNKEVHGHHWKIIQDAIRKHGNQKKDST